MKLSKCKYSVSLKWLLFMSCALTVCVSSVVFAQVRDVAFPLFPGNYEALKQEVVFNAYWTEDGKWVSEALAGDGTMLVTTYENDGGVLKKISSQPTSIPKLSRWKFVG